MKKKHALTVFVSPGSVVASERSGQQSQEQLLIFLGQEIDSDLHRSFCLENSNGKCCSACVCVCVWQLDRVPGQFRWVRVQTGGQSSGRNNERRAFENPEAERTGEHRLSRLNWLVLLLSETAQDTTGSVGSVGFLFLPVQQVEKATSTQGDKNEMEVSLYKSVQWSTASVPPESHYTVRAETDIKFLTRNISVCYVTWNRSCSPSSVLDVMFGRSSRCAVVRCTAWVIALHLVCGFFISFCRYGWPLQMATASTSCENKARGLPFSCDPSTHGKNISPQSAAVLLV